MDAVAHERARAVGAERDDAAKIAVVERGGGHGVTREARASRRRSVRGLSLA